METDDYLSSSPLTRKREEVKMGDKLVIPYAMSDINSGIATVFVSDLLGCMRKVD
jgi:hypothetical protein